MKVTCNRKDGCQYKGCWHANEHNENPTACHPSGCITSGGIKGAICLPEPALVRCDTAGECGNDECVASRDHKADHCTNRRGHYCRFADCHVRCNPVPEPAAPGTDLYVTGGIKTDALTRKPHGVVFKGNAPQLMRYLGGLTEERFQAMMHAGFTITDVDGQRKADAARVFAEMQRPQGYHDVAEFYRSNQQVEDEEARIELENRVLAEIHSFGALTRGATDTMLIWSQEQAATAHMMRLIGEGE